MASTRKLVLFDIDGTLVLTGGAGRRAMARACEDIVGHAGPLDGIPVAGRTDWVILHDTLGRLGRDLDEALFLQLRERYLGHLRDEIGKPGEGFKGVMPGVRELLDELLPREEVYLGLLTGNFEAGARIKLEHFDLLRYFRCGAFGDDAADRNALVPVAIERARRCGLPAVEPPDVLVVGDTPHDVACALAAGALPVAVATGGSTVAELRESGAQIVFEDLTDTDAFIRMLKV
ncbi:MAG TPA: HAD family hydrolase [Vicinamibacterales bacterium]|nr:HAD family hydrolase [Vicinamibacterales bacterium]